MTKNEKINSGHISKLVYLLLGAHNYKNLKQHADAKNIHFEDKSLSTLVQIVSDMGLSQGSEIDSQNIINTNVKELYEIFSQIDVIEYFEDSFTYYDELK